MWHAAKEQAARGSASPTTGGAVYLPAPAACVRKPAVVHLLLLLNLLLLNLLRLQAASGDMQAQYMLPSWARGQPGAVATGGTGWDSPIGAQCASPMAGDTAKHSSQSGTALWPGSPFRLLSDEGPFDADMEIIAEVMPASSCSAGTPKYHLRAGGNTASKGQATAAAATAPHAAKSANSRAANLASHMYHMQQVQEPQPGGHLFQVRRWVCSLSRRPCCHVHSAAC